MTSQVADPIPTQQAPPGEANGSPDTSRDRRPITRQDLGIALLFAAFLAGILAEKLPGEYGTTTDPSKERCHWVQAIELSTAEFGTTAGKITAVIAFAAITGWRVPSEVLTLLITAFPVSTHTVVGYFEI